MHAPVGLQHELGRGAHPAALRLLELLVDVRHLEELAACAELDAARLDDVGRGLGLDGRGDLRHELLQRDHRHLEVCIVLLRPLPGEVRPRVIARLQELVTPVDEPGPLGDRRDREGRRSGGAGRERRRSEELAAGRAKGSLGGHCLSPSCGRPWCRGRTRAVEPEPMPAIGASQTAGPQRSSATTRFWTSTNSTLSGSRGRGRLTFTSAFTVPGCGVKIAMRSARYTASATLWVT